MPDQQPLAFDVADLRSALRVEVDDEKPVHRALGNSAFVGCAEIDPDEPVRVVHVISSAARGEVRGYVLVRGELRLRLPCYSGAWAEVDALVSAELGASVAPYEIGPGGMEVSRV